MGEVRRGKWEPAGAGLGVGTGQPRVGRAEGARAGRRLGKLEGLTGLGRVELENWEKEPQVGETPCPAPRAGSSTLA